MNRKEIKDKLEKNDVYNKAITRVSDEERKLIERYAVDFVSQFTDAVSSFIKEVKENPEQKEKIVQELQTLFSGSNLSDEEK